MPKYASKIGYVMSILENGTMESYYGGEPEKEREEYDKNGKWIKPKKAPWLIRLLFGD